MQSKLKYQKRVMTKHVDMQAQIIESMRSAIEELEYRNDSMIDMPSEDAAKIRLALQLLNNVEDKASLAAVFTPNFDEDAFSQATA